MLRRVGGLFAPYRGPGLTMALQSWLALSPRSQPPRAATGAPASTTARSSSSASSTASRLGSAYKRGLELRRRPPAQLASSGGARALAFSGEHRRTGSARRTGRCRDTRSQRRIGSRCQLHAHSHSSSAHNHTSSADRSACSVSFTATCRRRVHPCRRGCRPGITALPQCYSRVTHAVMGSGVRRRSARAAGR